MAMLLQRVKGPIVMVGMLSVLAACSEEGLTAPRVNRVVTGRVDVGGYSLQVERRGGDGPTVVFLSGLNEPMATWRDLPASVAQFAGVVRYDRGGAGGSDAAMGSRSADAVAQELERLLAALRINTPVVLVGHSMGALHMHRFAQRNPAKVAGLVFVDGTPAAAALFLRDIVPPGLTLEQMLALVADDMQLTGGPRDEFLSQVTSAEQVAGGGPLPDVPVYVLTSMKVEAGGSAAERQGWFDMHRPWVTEVSRGTHIGTTQSGHHIHWDEPALVVDAIRAVVAMAR